MIAAALEQISPRTATKLSDASASQKTSDKNSATAKTPSAQTASKAPASKTVSPETLAPQTVPKKPAAKVAAPKPHYHGHRDRLRARFKQGGINALADYELLELCLFRSIPRRDVKPIAKELIAKFGSFAEVIAAPIPRLTEVKFVSDATALELKILQAAATKLGRESVMHRPILSSWSALLDYCRSAMQFERVEQFRVLFLDRKNRLIADEVMGQGTVDRAPVYPREIIKRALELEATALILAHNHPSGDPTPSAADITMTEDITKVCKGVGIAVHDHLIIGRDNIASFKTLGLM
ncbi:DNA repair protein RadC [Fretibacter rubidus]|uniref:RadC family protein n=1 Tax=Fretibacter rubidus TaxID=570162 RepID=UPI00352B7C95